MKLSLIFTYFSFLYWPHPAKLLYVRLDPAVEPAGPHRSTFRARALGAMDSFVLQDIIRPCSGFNGKPTFKIFVVAVLVEHNWPVLLTKGVCTAFRMMLELTVVNCIGAILQVRTGQCVGTATVSSSPFLLSLVNNGVIFNWCIRRAIRAISRRTDRSLVLVAECWAADLQNVSKCKQTTSIFCLLMR